MTLVGALATVASDNDEKDDNEADDTKKYSNPVRPKQPDMCRLEAKASEA